MTMERILELASTEAISIWFDAVKRLEERPESKICQSREARAWNEVIQLDQLRQSLS